jgi:hypothetical protein
MAVNQIIITEVAKDPVWRLIDVGGMLFGGAWRTKLPPKIGVTRQTIYRWIRHPHTIPENLSEMLAAACRRRAEDYTNDAARILKLAEFLEGK